MFHRFAALLVAFTLLTGCPRPGPINTNLFLDDAPTASITQAHSTPAAWISATRLARINAEQFFDRGFEPGSSQITVFNLFPDLSLDVRAQRYSPVGTGTVIWHGTDGTGEPVRIALAIDGRRINGEIHTLTETIRITPVEDDWHRIDRTDSSGFDPEAEPIEVAMTSDQKTTTTLRACDVPPEVGIPTPGPGKGPKIKVMVAYTPAAAASVGNTNIHADLLFDQLFTAWTESPYAHVYPELTQVQLLSQNASGNPQSDVRNLRTPTDGLWDEVHALRNQEQADLVAVIVGNMNGACGIGYRPSSPSPANDSYGFSISKLSCSLRYFTFAHELGHNLSMHHDRFVVTPQPAGTHHYGYSNPRLRLRTIMAYENYCGSQGVECRRWLGYSNPHLFMKSEVLGAPIGQTNAAHNRNILCAAAGSISQYR